MTPARCQQAGLVEALSDGRLGAPERQSVERHVATCAACAAWLRDLEAIRQALRAPVSAPTPLQHQRARLALLRGAVAEDEPRRPRHRRAWGILAVALVAGSAWATTVALRSASLPTPPLASTGSTMARPAGPSAATTAPRGAPAGTASTTTDAAEPVAPAPATTADAPVPASAPRPFGSSATSAIAPESTAPARRAPAAPAVEASSAAPAASAPAAPAPTLPSASHDFAEAMSALSRGDFARAAARFEAFTGAHPFDPRSDEAAYLIAIALERAGRTAESRAAARRYLQSRPRGAHRAQAEKMLGAQAP